MIQFSIDVRTHQNIFIIAVIAGVTTMMQAHRDAEENARRAVALQTAVAEADTEQLRAQTHPSFLFGTLSAIRDRVRPDPAGADDMIVRLGEFLRRRLHQPAGKNVTLEEELELAERYFELRSMRIAAPASMQLDVDENVLNVEVPPFALQTLLETAIGEQQPSSIVVRGHARGDFLALEVRATPVDAGARPAAIAEARLRQWFGADCGGSVRRDGDTMIALVDLRLRAEVDA
jgi:LytS/YehU family sensor histidine kinase